MENGWELTSELTSKWIIFNNTQSNFTTISLITFAVINQTSPNLQGSCRNNIQCCLQNYMENGWELTSELTFKWITFNNSQSNFTPSSLIPSAIIDRTSPNLHGSCRNTSLPCKFGEVCLIIAEGIDELGVKFDRLLLKVIHWNVNSDVNSQPFSM